MEEHQSVKPPHSLRSNGSHSQQELLNFTKSVINLEAVICHKSREPNEMVIQEKGSPHTLNVPRGADGFASTEYHANLKQNRNLEHCSNELAIRRQRVFQSPLKQPTHIVGNENGPKRDTSNQKVFINESDTDKLCDIHLSRIYFSQHSTNGNQTFQEAQTQDFQLVSETPSISEENTFTKRKIQFDETAMTRRSPTVEATKHLNHPNHPSPKKQNIKGLFQKPSNRINFHRKRIFSDKYVYFLSDSERSTNDSEKAVGCSQFKQRFNSGVSVTMKLDDNEGLSRPPKRKTLEEVHPRKEPDTSEMQVVVDSNGRVLVNVFHDSEKHKRTQHSQRPSAGYKNDHGHCVYSKESLCQASSLPAKQTKHIYAKMKVDGSFSEIGDATSLQEVTLTQQNRLYSSRSYGENVHVMCQDAKTCSEKNPAYHHISPSYVVNGFERDYGRVYQYQPIIGAHPISDASHSIGRQPPLTVYKTVGNNSKFHDYEQNTKQKSTNSVQTCYQSNMHSSTNKSQTTSFSKTTSHCFIPHQIPSTQRELKQQTTSQSVGNASQTEHLNNAPSHHDLDTARQSNAQLSNGSERRYRCDWPACTKAFRHYSFLVLHRRIHTGERPYNCSWEGCKKQFRRSDDYQRHYRVHTGVKPYPCSVCGKAFKRSDHRLFHYRAIHNMYKQKSTSSSVKE